MDCTPWTVAHQAPLFMGFSRQKYWSGLPFPSPGDLPNAGIEPGSPALEADALTSEPPGRKRKIARINGTEGMNAQFTKEENQMANKHMEKYSASLRNVN